MLKQKDFTIYGSFAYEMLERDAGELPEEYMELCAELEDQAYPTGLALGTRNTVREAMAACKSAIMATNVRLTAAASRRKENEISMADARSSRFGIVHFCLWR